MDKDYVDKFIKESLYNHETPIDNDLKDDFRQER